MTLRIAFMGTPDFAVPTFEAIAAAGHEIVAVFTRAPAASGRGLKETPSPVQRAASARGVPVRMPASLKDECTAALLAEWALDAAVVVAYGLLLPPSVLAGPRHGCLNLHASLLPRWRGAAPIHRAVMAGDRETGVAVMRMEAGLDTGPVGAQVRVAIGSDTTTGELHDELAHRGAGLMVQALAALEARSLAFVPQAEAGVTYARKIANAEARIDWWRPAGEVHDQVRGLSPWPGAFFEVDLGRGPERVKCLGSARAPDAHPPGPPGTLGPDGLVACGEGAIRLVTLQRGGRGATGADSFLRGARLDPGALLG